MMKLWPTESFDVAFQMGMYVMKPGVSTWPGVDHTRRGHIRQVAH